MDPKIHKLETTLRLSAGHERALDGCPSSAFLILVSRGYVGAVEPNRQVGIREQENGGLLPGVFHEKSSDEVVLVAEPGFSDLIGQEEQAGVLDHACRQDEDLRCDPVSVAVQTGDADARDGPTVGARLDAEQ